MQNKLTCHPEKPESGQQTNRQGKLDTSSSQPTVDNSPTCGNCGNFVPYCHRPDIGKCLKGIVHWTTYDIKAHDCPHYEPEQD